MYTELHRVHRSLLSLDWFIIMNYIGSSCSPHNCQMNLRCLSLVLDMHIVSVYSQNNKVLDTEPSSGQILMLCIKVRDVRRATLPRRSGNEGWIGLSPSGDRYHVVVPVDAQIAKGVMACNWPADGTPFGGYTGWLYFRCEPYDDEGLSEGAGREDCLAANCDRLLKFAASYGIACALGAECGEDPVAQCSRGLHARLPQRGAASIEHNTETTTAASQVANCGVCGKGWRELKDLLRDPTVRLVRYRVCPDDFSAGTYVFSHGCSGSVEVPVTRFGRCRSASKTLIGTHGCPGLCHYETALEPCSAECEGACYRRIAAKLKSRPTC
jgi:hypothetical protein